MINEEPKSMEEIHNIREKIYYETEGMAISEKLEFISRKAESFKSRHNLELRAPEIKMELAGK